MPLITNANDEGIEVEVNPIGQMSVDVISTGTGSPIVTEIRNVVTASDVPVADIGGRFTATNVEGVLAEIDDNVETKVPQRLSTISDIGTTTKSIRLNTNLYADSNGTSKRISLQAIKELNTKIVTTQNAESYDATDLSVGDYIYEEI